MLVIGLPHGRAFLIEVMGRNCGYLALMGGILGGAELTLIPERNIELEEIRHGSKVRTCVARITQLLLLLKARRTIQDVADFLKSHNVGFEVRSDRHGQNVIVYWQHNQHRAMECL